jgi:putative oxidoreductase
MGKSALKLLTVTNTNLLNIGVLLLRLTLGVIFFGVGASKVFGWFGGFGLDTTLQFYSKMGIPVFWSYCSIFSEFIGGFLLFIGLFTRPAAFVLMINMIVATILTLPSGFFVGRASYPFSIMMCTIVLLFTGPMAISLDSIIFSQKITRDQTNEKQVIDS